MSRVFAPTGTIFTLEFIWGRRARVTGVLFNRRTVLMLKGRISRVLKELPLWVFMEGPVAELRREHLGEKELLSALEREYGEGGAYGPQQK